MGCKIGQMWANYATLAKQKDENNQMLKNYDF
jgi:hypothetical protein